MKILAFWRAVGFLPMTQNAANDPKVRYELGPDGSPEDAGNILNFLVE